MIDPLGLVSGPGPTRSAVPQQPVDVDAAGKEFGVVLKEEMSRVDDLQASAQAAAEGFASGRGDDIESVLFAAREADTAFKMLLQVRSKVLEVYKEVKQLPS